MPSHNFSPIPSSLYQQAVTATPGGIGSGNIPSAARYAEGVVWTAAVVETRDGTTPTATKGNPWDAGDLVILRSRYEIVNFSAIEKTSTDSRIDWQFYNKAPGV